MGLCSNHFPCHGFRETYLTGFGNVPHRHIVDTPREYFSTENLIYVVFCDILVIVILSKKEEAKNPEMNSGVMNMIGRFSALRFTGTPGTGNMTFAEEKLLKMDRQRNKIKIPNA